MIRALVSLALACAPLCAQASFTTFGAGCVLDGQALAIGNQGLPQVGQSFDITYSGPNFAFSSAQQSVEPVLVLGLGQATVPIPAGILPFQPAGCTGLITSQALIRMPLSPNGMTYASSYSFAIPNNPAFVGAQFFAQWGAFFTQCGFAGCDLGAIATSDAAVCVVGP